MKRELKVNNDGILFNPNLPKRSSRNNRIECPVKGNGYDCAVDCAWFSESEAYGIGDGTFRDLICQNKIVIGRMNVDVDACNSNNPSNNPPVILNNINP